MRKEDLIKYALIAGALYVAYRYMEANGLLAQWFGIGVQPVPTPAPHPTAGTAVATATPTSAAAAAASLAASAAVAASNAATVQQQVDQSYLERAAANSQWATDPHVSGVKLTWDEWNYYLSKYAVTNNAPAQAIYGPEDVGLVDRNTLLTAVQYHDMKAAKGLSGLLEPADISPYRRWTQ